MVTEASVPNTNRDYTFDFMGLSTDEKPTITDFPNMKNGSTFLEMDTKAVYFYDAENGVWV